MWSLRYGRRFKPCQRNDGSDCSHRTRPSVDERIRSAVGSLSSSCPHSSSLEGWHRYQVDSGRRQAQRCATTFQTSPSFSASCADAVCLVPPKYTQRHSPSERGTHKLERRAETQMLHRHQRDGAWRAYVQVLSTPYRSIQGKLHLCLLLAWWAMAL